MAVHTRADAVRDYLQFLEDPSKLVDPDEVARLTALATTASDPLERLRAVTDLQRAQQGDAVAYRLGFITHAKTWAQENDVPAESFIQLGVDRATLREAGFEVRQLRGSPANATASRGKSAIKNAPVSAADIKTSIAGRKGKFTLAEIAASAGGSPMTVRKAVEELIRDGVVERVGPTPNWKNQGRAPILFQAARTSSKRR